MKTVTICNLKGGVSKTQSIYQIAGILANREYRVLCVDLDPQGNLTTAFGISLIRDAKTTRDIFTEEPSHFNDIVVKGKLKDFPTLDILPAHMKLHEAEYQLPFTPARELILKNYILDYEEYFNHYDYIFFDMNPSVGYLNQNALAVSDKIILALNPDLNCLTGARLFEAIWYNIRRKLRIENNICAKIITMDQSITNISKLFKDAIYNSNEYADIKEGLCDTVIPLNTKLRDSILHCCPIVKYDNKCKGYEAYNNLVDELFRRGVL